MFRQVASRCSSLPVLRTQLAQRELTRSFWHRPPFLPVPIAREFEHKMAQMQHEFDRVINSNFWRPFAEHPTSVEAFRVKNPIIEENGKKLFKLEFDVRRFKPEDVKISTDAIDKSLTIEAKYSDANSKYEYQRRITIPDGVTPSEITCTYKSDGVLHLEAPYVEPIKPNPPKDTVISIDHK